MKLPSISIVIPCKNEVKNIGLLLDSILMQKSVDILKIPIIVADAGSTDGTLNVIERYRNEKGLNIMVVPGGYPAAGRNAGASYADSDYLIFLDADITLGEPDFLDKVLHQAANGNHHLISSYIRCKEGNWFDHIFWKLYSISLFVAKLTKPMCTGMFFCIRKDIFQQLGGFDETVILGEDVELAQKVDKKRFGVADTFIYTTNRRFKRMGYLNTIRYYIMVAFSPSFRHKDNRFYFEEERQSTDHPTTN